jgi:hypothetical protein
MKSKTRKIGNRIKEIQRLSEGGKMVRLAGLEPARVTPLPPQSSVSANSTISAKRIFSRSLPAA